MRRNDIAIWVNLLAKPVLLTILGLVLLLKPDSASAFIATGAAWILILIGAGSGIAAAFGDPVRRNSRLLRTAICLAVGIWLLCNPLVLAKSLGRFLGIFLMILGGQDLSKNLKYSGEYIVFSPSLLLPGATVLIGLVLLAFPMATSRILFTVCGIVLICVGVGEIFDRIRNRKNLDEGNGPDIIDAL